MDNFTPDESQLLALETWYPVSHELHLNPRHPCIKLAGEAGELLDLYGKEEYKPGFSWWDCKRCDHVHIYEYCGKVVGYSHITEEEVQCQCLWYTPKVLDELGDYSYYLRILAYIKGVTFNELCEGFRAEWFIHEDDNSVELLLELLSDSTRVLEHFLYDNEISIPYLRDSAFTFLAILHKLDCTLPHLLELNYKKLNTESQHGWKSATIKRNTPTTS